MEEKYIEQGKRIREAFEYLKSINRIKNQKAFAKEIGCGESQISKAMKGSKDDMTTSLIKKICYRFRNLINEQYLIDGTGKLIEENQLQTSKTEQLKIDYVIYKQLYDKINELEKEIIELVKENSVLKYKLQQYEEKEKRRANAG